MNPAAYLLPTIVVAVVMAILQLVAIWAGVSRRSWFVRALTVCLVLAAMLPIRALEPVVWHAFALPLTAVCSRWLGRRLGDQPRGERVEPGVRFSLQQVFLFLVLAGGLSAAVASLWHDGAPPRWENAVLVACAAVISQLCLLAVLLSRWWRLLPLVAILLLSGGIGALAAWVFGASLDLQLTSMFPDMFPGTYHVLGLCSAAYVVMSAVIFVILMSAKMALSEQRRLANAGRIRLLVVAVVVFIPMSALYLQMLPSPPIPTDHYPAANNYVEIMHHVHEVVRLNPSELDLFSMRRGPSPATVRELERHYDDLLPILHTPGHVPLDLHRHTTHQYMQVVDDDTRYFRSVCRIFDAESQAAIANGKFGDAANYSLAMVQMGNTISRGGMAYHMLTGTAMERVGTSRLWKIHANLTPDELRKLVKDLERVRAAREGFDLAAAREFAFTDRTYGWMHRVLSVTSKFTGYDSTARVMSVSKTAYERRTKNMSLLLAELAVAAYRKEHGEAPNTLDQLVPDYLTTVPLDPRSGRPVILRKTADGVVVL